MADPVASGTSLLGRVDQFIADFFSQWNVSSTIIVGLVLIVVVYPLFTSKEPDTHPFLLARQANQSPIRLEGESATYRSTEIPYGYPMRSGLGIKDPGASKWTSGRDGDLRDVWRQAVSGSMKDDGASTVPTAKITTILGVEKVVEHDLRELSLIINVIGKYLKEADSNGSHVRVSSNDEIAGAFYGWSPVLLPYNQTPDSTKELLNAGEFDTLIAEAGSVSLDTLTAKNRRIRRVVWITKAASGHLDWKEVPEGAGGKLEITTWTDLVEEHRSGASNEILPLDKDHEAPSIFAYWLNRTGNYDLIEYTQKNLMAGAAALQSSLPRNHKLDPVDSVLSTIPLTITYSLCWSLLALFTGSTLILNSVSGPTANILAVIKSERQKLKPTYIITDARSIPRFGEDLALMSKSSGLVGKYSSWTINRAIAQGYLPEGKPTYLPSALKGLKVLYIAQQDIVEKSGRVTSGTLSNLRTLLGSRISLALTSGRVAGPVTQTNIFDYRNKGEQCCVGVASASLELNLTGPEEEMMKLDGTGAIVVKGPSVASKEKDKIEVDLQARADTDNTIILV